MLLCQSVRDRTAYSTALRETPESLEFLCVAKKTTSRIARLDNGIRGERIDCRARPWSEISAVSERPGRARSCFCHGNK